MKFRMIASLLICSLFVDLAAAQTNIIQIIADDMGWTDLSSNATNLGNGSGFYETPNLDALASGGMSFSSAYVQPVCSPTRAALLTGQYAPRNGLHNVGSLDGGNDTLLVVPEDGSAIKNEATTIAELLRDAGYVTAHIGKFHATGNANQITSQHGFQINIGGTSSGGPNGTIPYFAEEVQPGVWQFGSAHGPEFDVYADPYNQNYIAENLLPFANANDPLGLENTAKHLSDAMADAAIDFLIDRTNDGSSFFVNVAFNAVHTDINPRSDLENKYQGIRGTASHSRADYAGLLEGMDQAIGRILQFVQTSSLADDTLIIFLSDNGALSGVSSSAPLSGGKGQFLEGGIRVPMIAYQPGIIQPGSTTGEAVHAVDFYPTYAQLAGVNLPNPTEHVIDGESFADILQGQTTELDRDTIFYYFPGYTNNGNVPFTFAIHDAVDGNRYKLSYGFESRAFELYNLTADISETNDLVASGMTSAQFGIASCLAQRLNEWMIESGAELPTVRATGNTVPTIGHTPTIAFDLTDSGFGQTIDGLSEASVEQLGIEMSVQATGQDAVFDSGGSGVGVNSSLDGGGQNLQRRIDGSLNVPEKFNISFDRDVLLKSIGTNQLSNDGSEQLVLDFVSGDNPFVGLNGYQANGFKLQSESLGFVRSGNGFANAFEVRLGTLDQDELLLTAGTQISVTADPATDGGFVLSSIRVALADVVIGDTNLDGSVNLLDVESFVQLIGGDRYQVEADINKDGIVNLLDVAPFVALLSGV